MKAISMYKLGSNSFNGDCINAIKLNFKVLLKGEIKHFREVPGNEMLGLDTAGNDEFTNRVIKSLKETQIILEILTMNLILLVMYSSLDVRAEFIGKESVF